MKELLTLDKVIIELAIGDFEKDKITLPETAKVIKDYQTKGYDVEEMKFNLYKTIGEKLYRTYCEKDVPR
jgi:hypothetical protein